MDSTLRDLVLAPDGARGDVPPPSWAKVANVFVALVILVGRGVDFAAAAEL